MRTVLKAGLLLLAFFPGPAFARATSANVQTFLPAMDDSRYLLTSSSPTLQRAQFRAGIFLNYGRNPLEVGLAARRAGLVEHLVMADLFFAVGVTDWFQLGLDVPGAPWGRATNFITNETVTFFRLGDVRLEPKFRILEIDRYHVGIALLPFITGPTGDGNILDVDPAASTLGRVGVGNNSFTGGAKLVVDFDILRRLQIAVNTGYLARDNVIVLNTRQDDMVLYSVAAHVVATKWMHLIGEVYGSTLVSRPFESEGEMPLEFLIGLRFLPPQVGVQLTFGGGAGLTLGYGSPDYRAIFGISYLKPRRVELPPAPPIPEEEAFARVEKQKIVITRKIHFEFDKAVIRPVSFPVLNSVVGILKQNRDIRKVRIEGHTDFFGSDRYNMRLSQRRSDAVRQYLIAHGISDARLIAIGFGETQPIATNETEEGRARNRRVEFIILEQIGFQD